MYGGAEAWMITAIKEFMSRGHQVTLICRPDAKILHYAKNINIEVITLKMRGDFDPITILKVARILKKKKIDFILTNMDKELRFAGLAARLVNKKNVICLKGVDRPLKNNLRYRLTYNLLASKVVVNSNATKNSLLKSAPWLQSDKIRVIYHGIDPILFSHKKTKDLRAELGIHLQHPLIGFVGRLNVQKGVTYLLQAFEQVLKQTPEAELLIVGEGDLKKDIETTAKEKGFRNSIHLVGFRDDIPNVMSTIDLLILPSVWEGFGIVLIEAMAAEKPCVTTNISSMPEIVINGKTGYVVPPENSGKLAEAIIELVQDPLKANGMGSEGKKVVQTKFTLKKMIDQYEHLFSEYQRF
jgi:glycosyltransferase involved in cell wall biosynthesis